MSSQQWLEVALTFEPEESEVAEAVAQTLARLSEGRVVWSYEHPQADAVDLVQHWGPMTVKAYLPCREETRDIIQRRVEEALWHLHVIQPLPQARFRVLHDEDWLHAWKRFYRPIEVGQKLLVVPAWIHPPSTNRVPIFIEPGTAFGTGMHPSTRLCLEALESHVQPEAPVVDVGCGSGILSIAAAKLGARPVVAIDIEEEAVRETRANARLNGVEHDIQVFQGSVSDLLARGKMVQKAPLVVANIFADVLVALLEEGLDRLLLPGKGVLVLSGILEDREQEVHQAAQRRRLSFLHRAQEGEWVCLHYQASKTSR